MIDLYVTNELGPYHGRRDTRPLVDATLIRHGPSYVPGYSLPAPIRRPRNGFHHHPQAQSRSASPARNWRDADLHQTLQHGLLQRVTRLGLMTNDRSPQRCHAQIIRIDAAARLFEPNKELPGTQVKACDRIAGQNVG